MAQHRLILGVTPQLHKLIKASETLVPSNCTGLILVLEVMAENHRGYHEQSLKAIYITYNSFG
jgi:hypothetical protein